MEASIDKEDVTDRITRCDRSMVMHDHCKTGTTSRRALGWMIFCLMMLTSLSTITGCATAEEQQKKKNEEIYDADFHYELGAGHFQEEQPTLAIRELTIAIEKDPKHVRAHYLMGYILMGRHNYNGAIKHFKAALDEEPEFYDARNALGATYLAMERWRDAIDLFSDLLDEPLYTSPELAHNNLGWAYYNLRRYNEAIVHFRRATFLKPEFCLGYNNLGLALDASHNRSEAARNYRRAIELCPTNYAEPHFNLGKLYQSEGDLQLARTHFERCSTLSPNSPLGDRCREYLRPY